MNLLPCPFCGGAAEIERKGDRRVSTIYACTECGCRLETGEEWGHGTRWNQRTPPAPSVRQALEVAGLQLIADPSLPDDVLELRGPGAQVQRVRLV